MRNETNENEGQKGEGLYRQLVEGAQDLTRRLSTHKGTENFVTFVEEHKSLREQLIRGYDSIDPEKYQRAGTLLNHVKQYLHETLDVQRIRDINASLNERRK